MPLITLTVKTKFGDIQISGSDPDELLLALDWLKQDYVSNLNEKVSSLIADESRDSLKGIVDIHRNGPLLITNVDLSHYESIALILYSMKDYQASAKEIKEILAKSGRKIVVAARLHEMVKKGLLLKPVNRGTLYRLTTKALGWLEKRVLPRIQEAES